MARTFPATPPNLKRPIVLWDTETTGLGPAKNSLVEIGLMELRCTAPHQSVYSFSSLIHPPGVSMPRAASRVHGITNPMMQDAPSFAEVWSGVVEYIDQVSASRGRPLLVAHNLGFDLSFLREELRRIGQPLPDWDFACSLRDVAHVIWPGQKASLAALAERFSIVNEEAHRALCDVEATGKILETADDELREASRRSGQPVKPKGEYIREVLEKAALKRRPNMQESQSPQTPQGGQSQKTNTVEQGRPSVSAAKPVQQTVYTGLQQYYITPTGALWHSSRCCDRLDMANVILRVTRRPIGKLPCQFCSKRTPGRTATEAKGGSQVQATETLHVDQVAEAVQSSEVPQTAPNTATTRVSAVGTSSGNISKKTSSPRRSSRVSARQNG